MSTEDVAKTQANGPVIMRRRKANGWSRKGLAEKAEVSYKTVQRAEDSDWLRVNTLGDIAAALELEPWRIMMLGPDAVRPDSPDAGGGGPTQESAARIAHESIAGDASRMNLPPSPQSALLSGNTEIHFADLIAYHCAAFAGRIKEIATIDACLSEADSGYVFVEGPSGYGKTALLAYLTTILPDAAYHFLSQALAGTSILCDPNSESFFLTNLCGQVLRKTNGRRRVPTHDLRAAYLSLLSEPGPSDMRTLVIIDAVDEIDPSQSFLKGLFPHRLGSGVYVIFSARTVGDRDYLRHVGLSAADISLTVKLERLDLRGIVALLKKAGGRAAPLAEDGRFANALLETSDGDPFHLRFLAEDVRDGRIGPTNVRETPRGLYDYLDLQFELLSQRAQRQQQRDVLGYILTAKGPLSRAALISRVQGLDAINFDTTISGIRRFLLERGGEFTFCHERFKEYFRHKAGMNS